LKLSTLILTENYNHTSSQSQKHSTVTSITQISVSLNFTEFKKS